MSFPTENEPCGTYSAGRISKFNTQLSHVAKAKYIKKDRGRKTSGRTTKQKYGISFLIRAVPSVEESHFLMRASPPRRLHASKSDERPRSFTAGMELHHASKKSDYLALKSTLCKEVFENTRVKRLLLQKEGLLKNV